MNEIFLLKLGEIVLKGANKRQFESRLRQNVRRRMKLYGNFDVYLMQSTLYVEPMDEDCDVDGAWVDYASRPRLSSRLTLSGRTFLKKP